MVGSSIQCKIKRFWKSESGNVYCSLFDDAGENYLIPSDVCSGLHDYLCRYLPIAINYVQKDGYRVVSWFSLVKVHLFVMNDAGERVRPVAWEDRTLVDFYQSTTIPKTNYQKVAFISQREWDSMNDGSVPPVERERREERAKKMAEKRRLAKTLSKPPQALIGR